MKIKEEIDQVRLGKIDLDGYALFHFRLKGKPSVYKIRIKDLENGYSHLYVILPGTDELLPFELLIATIPNTDIEGGVVGEMEKFMTRCLL